MQALGHACMEISYFINLYARRLCKWQQTGLDQSCSVFVVNANTRPLLMCPLHGTKSNPPLTPVVSGTLMAEAGADFKLKEWVLWRLF